MLSLTALGAALGALIIGLITKKGVLVIDGDRTAGTTTY